MMHGWQKLGGLDFSGMAQTVGFFASLGLPAVVAWLVALGELGGGILLVLGLFTRVAASWLTLIMIGAIVATYNKGPMVFYPISLLAIQVSLMMTGAGNWSADEKLANRFKATN